MVSLVQRVAADGGNRVLVNPTTLIDPCEIDKNAKFLQPLTNKKGHQGSSPGGHSFDSQNLYQ
jgi:hypothetical protein